MNRRSMLKNAAGAAAGLATLGVIQQAKAQEAPAQVVASSEIGRNHGHELVLSASDILTGIQNGGASLEIQGRSGHGHKLEVSLGEFIKLAVDGQIELTSAVGAGHTHSVSLSLQSL